MALLIVWVGTFTSGFVLHAPRINAALPGLACSAVGATAIVVGIDLRGGADYVVALPVMIALAAAPGVVIAMAGNALAATRDDVE